MRIQALDALKYSAGEPAQVTDRLTVEAALQVRINGEAYTTTMRTPGDDHVLVKGLLFTEGIIVAPDAPIQIEQIMDPETGLIGCLELTVDETWLAKPFEGRRSIMSTSSCGFCGTREASDLLMEGEPLKIRAEEQLDINLVPTLFERMRERQRTFDQSGGSHASAAFTIDGELLALFEDVGRHNAVDKVIGQLLENGALGRARCLIVSGRLSYEIVFKAFRAGLAFNMAVSAPSSLAVEMAQSFGMTVIGFCRGSRATVYSNPANIRQSAGTGSDLGR